MGLYFRAAPHPYLNGLLKNIFFGHSMYKIVNGAVHLISTCLQIQEFVSAMSPQKNT